jgi:hypothetical protein
MRTTAANQSASIEAPPAAPPAAAVIAPPPAPAAQQQMDRPESDELAELLARRIKDQPRDLSAHLDYQLWQFVRDQSVPQLEMLASMPAEDREVLTAVLDGLSNFRNGVRADANMLLSRKISPILAMADRLRSQAELSLPTVILCKRVTGFGVYEPMEPARFMAGREQPAILYCEVAHFYSQLTAERKWETRLSHEVVLYSENGMQVWPETSKPESIVDVARNRRHDFFLVKMLRLPATLTIGRYLLKVTVVDQHAGRVAEATVPIQIVAE